MPPKKRISGFRHTPAKIVSQTSRWALWYEPYLLPLGLILDDRLSALLRLLLSSPVQRLGGKHGRAAERLDLPPEFVGAGLDRHAGAVEGEREQTALSLQTLVADGELGRGG